jgi:hypothetical protein
MGYPYVTIEDTQNSKSLIELISRTRFKSDEFDEKRIELYKNYSKTARELNLPLRLF